MLGTEWRVEITKRDNSPMEFRVKYGAKRPWLSLWESCQPNRLTERVLRLMVESVYRNVGPSQTAPYGAASSPKGRAKVASLSYHVQQNTIHRNTQSTNVAGG